MTNAALAAFLEDEAGLCDGAELAAENAEQEQVAQQKAKMFRQAVDALLAAPERRFPVMRGVAGSGGFSIPWSLVAPFEKQALCNHGGQTLDRLAERGGLDATELWAVMHVVEYRDRTVPSEAEALKWALGLVNAAPERAIPAEFRARVRDLCETIQLHVDLDAKCSCRSEAEQVLAALDALPPAAPEREALAPRLKIQLIGAIRRYDVGVELHGWAASSGDMADYLIEHIPALARLVADAKEAK